VRFLAFDGASGGEHGRRTHVTIPAWAFRVTAPLVSRRGLDLFQRVVLGLCQSGIRTPDRIHELTQLHVRLCAHIIDRSRHEGLLNQDGDVTEQGRAALRTGTVDGDTEWAVRYVFFDPVTTNLWPRTVERLSDAFVLNVTAGDAVIDLGTAGKPNKVKALRMRLNEVAYGSPVEPNPGQILEVTRRDRQARIAARIAAFSREYNLGPLPELEAEQATYGSRIASEDTLPELSQVSFIGDPEPVEILGMMEVAPADKPGEGWTPHDPFGVGTNAMFGDLIIAWAGQRDSELAARLNQLTEHHNAEFWAAHSKRAQRARTQAEAELIGRYGPHLRQDTAVLERLVTIQVAAHEGEHAGAVSLIKQGTFGLYEELVFRLVIAHPLPRELADPLQQRVTERDNWRRRRRDSTARGSAPRQLWTFQVAKDAVRNAAESLGAYDVPAPFLNVDSDALGRLVKYGPERMQFGTVLAACLLTAAQRAEHPLRRLIGERPNLLFELDSLRQLRNPQAHRLGESTTVVEDLRWCQELANSAIPELLELPPKS
jgi:hypothetical protein